MSWTNKYLPPLIPNEKPSLKGLLKMMARFRAQLAHSFSIHGEVKPAEEKLPVISDNENVFNTCRDIYQESDKRINDIEQKSIQTFTYISVVAGAVVYTISKSIEHSIVATIFLCLSFALLLLSGIASFRCWKIKTRYIVFLPDIYDFNTDPPSPASFESIGTSMLKAAACNHTVADSTADILSTSRNLLFAAFLVGLLGSLYLFLTVPPDQFVDRTDMKTIDSSLNRLTRQMSVSDSISSTFMWNYNINQRLDSVQAQLQAAQSKLITTERELDSIKHSLSFSSTHVQSAKRR